MEKTKAKKNKGKEMKKMKEKKVVVAVEASALAGNGMSRLSLSLSLSFSRARARWSDRPWIPFVLLSGWINLHLSAVLAGLLLHGLPVHIDDAWRTERERERERRREKRRNTRIREEKKTTFSSFFSSSSVRYLLYRRLRSLFLVSPCAFFCAVLASNQKKNVPVVPLLPLPPPPPVERPKRVLESQFQMPTMSNTVRDDEIIA